MEKEDLKQLLCDMLFKSVAEDYVRPIADAILDDVADDLKAAADPDFSIGDIRYAIGRVLVDRLGIEL